MGNCLVKKLKAVVDNPNLPVFEPTLQFTLDVIEASGNTQMTNAQKIALNHFFYQIDVESENGIFSKINHMFLPMICGKNSDKALYDYKSERSYTLPYDIAYSSDYNGLVYIGEANYGRALIKSYETPLSNNFCHIAGFANAVKVRSILFSTNGSTPCGELRISSDSIVPAYGSTEMPVIASVNNTNNNVIFNIVTDNNSQGWRVVMKGKNEVYESSLSVNDPIIVNSYSLCFKGTPVGLAMAGDKLTQAEQNKLAGAVRDVCNAFS